MSSCNKTPVAILHELCVHRSIVEQFTVIGTSGTPNDPLFDMCCETSTGLRAVGTGKTKKEAKHNAAKAMLKRLDLPAITLVEGKETVAAPSVNNPHAERNATGNAIGRLQEYCSQNDLPAPKYDLVGDEGEPHERTFSIRCSVSQRCEVGIGRTKQQAKHNAAQAMFDNLQKNSLCRREVPLTTPTIAQTRAQPNNLTKEELEAVQRIYSEVRPISSLPATSPGLKFSLYHDSMRDLLKNVKNDLQKQTFSSPSETLKTLVENLNLTLTYHPGQSLDCGSPACIIYAVVNTQPTTVRIGVGSSGEEATIQAALNVLSYWQQFVGYYPQSVS